jgi:uncharacterized protein (TIGR03435 family)
MTTWTHVAGWTLVHFVWQGALVALATAAALRALRAVDARLRYGIACTALGLMLIAPVATMAAIALRTPGQPIAATLQSGATTMTTPAGRFSPTVATPATTLVPRLTIETALPIVVGLWLIGVSALFARLAGGAWRVRRFHRASVAMPASRWRAETERLAARLRLTRAVHVVDTDGVETPTVVGWLRPVILLPIAALGGLSVGQVEAILAHELAHVRRHDYLVNLVQTIAETLLFYHPGVWWVSSRIRAEREHCCDDIAVDVCGDAVRYAEALTELAAWGTTHAPLAVAATSGSLLGRVRRILQPAAAPDRMPPRHPGAIVVAMVLVIGGGIAVTAASQVGLGSRLNDPDYAGIRPHIAREFTRVFRGLAPPAHVNYDTRDVPGAPAWSVSVTYPGGRMPFMGFTARGVIRYAYDLADLPVVDGPSWIDDQSFAVEAWTGAAAPSEADLRFAIRSALERQFRLVAHPGVRDFPVYALVMANGGLGPNIRQADGTCYTVEMMRAARAGSGLPHGRTRPCGVDNTFTGPSGAGVTPAEIARSLRQPWFDRDVIDRTGLSGRFDYSLQVGPLPLALLSAGQPWLVSAFAPLGVVPIERALEEQLGMKVEEATAPQQVLVIDRVEEPARTGATMQSATPGPPSPPAAAVDAREQQRRQAEQERQTQREIHARLAELRTVFERELLRAAPSPQAASSAASSIITGTLTDQLNNFLPDVHVTAVNRSGQIYQTTTGGTGEYTLNGLPSGEYTISVSRPGFRELRWMLTMAPGQTATLDQVMPLGTVQETITVVNDGVVPVDGPGYRHSPIPARPARTAPGVGGELRPPRKLRNVRPIYPVASGEGVVSLSSVIGVDGYVKDVHVLSALDAALGQAAVDAVSQWEFDPTVLDGLPVETLMEVTVQFRNPR